MYATLRRLYLEGRLDDTGLNNAVTKKWITQAQADQIRAEKLQQDTDQGIMDGLLVKELAGE